jgi:hypothetical protein
VPEPAAQNEGKASKAKFQIRLGLSGTRDFSKKPEGRNLAQRLTERLVRARLPVRPPTTSTNGTQQLG